MFNSRRVGVRVRGGGVSNFEGEEPRIIASFVITLVVYIVIGLCYCETSV